MDYFSLHVDEQNKLLRVKAAGRVLKADAADVINTARREAMKNDLNILYDLQAAKTTLTAFDWYELPRELEVFRTPTARRIRAGALISERDDVGNLKFFENVLHNLGFNVKIFFHDEDAVRWLAKNS
ncbi:MAG: hypothetical protein JSS81_12805 [Acidobacteria bacterium]|nr:hypothetical protein [Acidobacteriota bacterium]